jgi:RND family efflux transporter MFP subunit
LILPPIVAGVALVIGADAFKKPPERVDVRELAVNVRTINAPNVAVIPKVVGYGIIRPGRVWQALAKVSGPVVSVHPDLKAGGFIRAGAELLRIDPAEYELAIAQIDSELAFFEVKARGSQLLLDIEKKSIALQRRDLERKQLLLRKGTGTQVAVESAQRALLLAEAKAQALRNTLTQIEADRKVLSARRATADLNLERTTIEAPFDIRVTEVLTETTQYANKGQVLVTADGMASAEVTAHIPIGRLRPLVQGTAGAGWFQPTAAAVTGGPFGLDAKVRVRRLHGDVEWPARVVRISESIDPQTQTIGIIVAVDSPFVTAEPGRRPLLQRNMFVEVVLTGRPLENQIVMPFSALHQGRAYVVSDDLRLEIRSVKIKFQQARYVVIEDGIRPDETVVVGDLVPAIEGMLLKPMNDERMTRRIATEAQGHEPESPQGINQ